MTHWSDREPDEELEDWMLRVQVSTLAAEQAAVAAAVKLTALRDQLERLAGREAS